MGKNSFDDLVSIGIDTVSNETEEISCTEENCINVMTVPGMPPTDMKWLRIPQHT